MAALALGDEHPPLADPDIVQAQAEHLAAAQPAEQHRLHHGPVAVRCAAPSRKRVDLGGPEHPRQRPRRPDQRAPRGRAVAEPPGRQPARHRVVGDAGVAARDQVVEQTRDAGEPALDRARRQPGLAVLQPDHAGPRRGARCCLMNASTSGCVTAAGSLPTTEKKTFRS